MKLQRIEGQRVCWTTHPDYPNYDGRARGRVLHLEHISKDAYAYPASQCGMRITEFVTESEYGILCRSVCKQCVHQRDQWKDRLVAEPSRL